MANTEDQNQNAALSNKSKWARVATQLCYALMLLLMVVTSLPGSLPEGVSATVILTVKLLPLLLVLPALVKDSLRGYIWLCFIVLFYFTQSVVETFLSLGSMIDIIITIVSSVLFISAMLYVKWQRDLGRSL